MDKPLLCCRRFAREETGVTAIEYALIASLLAVAIVVGVANTGTALNELWTQVATCVTNAVQGNTC